MKFNGQYDQPKRHDIIQSSMFSGRVLGCLQHSKQHMTVSDTKTSRLIHNTSQDKAQGERKHTFVRKNTCYQKGTLNQLNEDVGRT